MATAAVPVPADRPTRPDARANRHFTYGRIAERIAARRRIEPCPESTGESLPDAESTGESAGESLPGGESAGESAIREKPSSWVEPADGQCPVSHPVKAKLGSGIFHVPGAQMYERTRADRCYADAASAEADGLRASKR